jgi:hypothetical protein
VLSSRHAAQLHEECHSDGSVRAMAQHHEHHELQLVDQLTIMLISECAGIAEPMRYLANATFKPYRPHDYRVSVLAPQLRITSSAGLGYIRLASNGVRRNHSSSFSG